MAFRAQPTPLCVTLLSSWSPGRLEAKTNSSWSPSDLSSELLAHFDELGWRKRSVPPPFQNGRLWTQNDLACLYLCFFLLSSSVEWGAPSGEDAAEKSSECLQAWQSWAQQLLAAVNTLSSSSSS